MMKKMNLLACVMLLAAFMATAQNSITKTFSGIKQLKMNTASGNCKITRSAGAEVNVMLKHTYNDPGYQPTMEQEGSLLVIKEKFQNDNVSGSASWSLTVPDEVTISFSAGSGNVEVTGLKSDIEVTSGSGDLYLSNVKGDVKGRMGSGDVGLENFEGRIKATTGSGNIKITKSSGDISVTCGSGDLQLTDSQGTIFATNGSGDISGRNLTLRGVSKLTTGSGDVEVILAATPQFDLSITSGSGDAELDYNGNNIVGKIVMKASKNRGSISAPFEFDKTEEIGTGDDATIQKTVVKGNASVRIAITTGSGEAALRK